jgi:hypothetical protein
MPFTIVPIFVSSTWLDLQPEREVVDKLLRRLKDAKFVGMEYFGSDDGTTRAASLEAVNHCELYIGIIGGRYGSGITEAEYDAARARQLPCLVYLKTSASIREEERDPEPEKRARLERFKNKLKDQRTGHLVAEFGSPGELAILVGANLHNWLFEQQLSPALTAARSAPSGEGPALADAIDRFTELQRQLIELVGEHPEVSSATRRVALDILYKLTYDARSQLRVFPGTAARREEIALSNVRALERLVAANARDHEVLRELAVNWRLVAEARLERGDQEGARAAFQASADACATLLTLEPGNALYQRDHAVSHFNLGSLSESQAVPDPAAALREYEIALPSARNAARLDPRWQAERDQIEAAAARLTGV